MSKRFNLTRKNQFVPLLFSLIILTLVILAEPTGFTPPDYKTFGREQCANYSLNPSDLMRIWIVYVGQGDGILSQKMELPCAYQEVDPQISVQVLC